MRRQAKKQRLIYGRKAETEGFSIVAAQFIVLLMTVETTTNR